MEICIWQAATGRELARLRGHRSRVTSLAFSPTGDRLVSGGFDTAALVWDVAQYSRPGRSQPAELSAQKLAALWNELGSKDAEQAFRALGTLASAPGQSVPFLQEQLRLLPPTGPDTIPRLLADLDHESFAVREKAMAILQLLGSLAEPALKKTLAGAPSAEVRSRVRRLLSRLEKNPEEGFFPDQLRGWRAVEALERIAGAEAVQALTVAARGKANPWLTQEANAALDRLAKRSNRLGR
jgi:hypothetical protein